MRMHIEKCVEQDCLELMPSFCECNSKQHGQHKMVEVHKNETNNNIAEGNERGREKKQKCVVS